MRVKLVAITEPKLDEVSSVEEFVAYVARVSNPGNQNNSATAAKLLKYLISNEHWSPLEMVHIVMQIDTTRDIARQILRHRSFSFQEFSQRYSVANEFEDIELRLQGDKNRQVSEKLLPKNTRDFISNLYNTGGIGINAAEAKQIQDRAAALGVDPSVLNDFFFSSRRRHTS